MRSDGRRAMNGANQPPTVRAWTREQLQESAKVWMKANSDGCIKDEYYASLGLLIDFVTDLFDGVDVQTNNTFTPEDR
jgi:hypothetical protein